MKVTPLFDNVIVQAKPAEEVRSSGIVLPDTMSKERPQEGVVIAVGTGKVLEDGKTLPMTIKKGDVVLFKKYSPTEVKMENEKGEEVEYFFIKEEDILAVVTK